MTAKNRIILYSGVILTALSLFLAYGYEYKHFYEILVIGLFLTLYVPVGNLITTDEYREIFKKFFKAGLVADLLLGVAITGLWHYNYGSVWDYIPLYCLVYPFAGLVMLQSYVLVKDRLMTSTGSRRPLSISFYSRTTKFFIFLSLSLAVIAVFINDRRLLWPSLFLSIAIYVLLALSYRARAAGSPSLFDEVVAHPVRLLAVILVVSYLNAMLHEIPNVTAQEWTYSDWPLQSTQLFGVPIVVLIAWPFLTLYPAAVYYSVKAKSKNRRSDSLFEKLFPFTLPPKAN
jgi:hypothetical protein